MGIKGERIIDSVKNFVQNIKTRSSPAEDIDFIGTNQFPSLSAVSSAEALSISYPIGSRSTSLKSYLAPLWRNHETEVRLLFDADGSTDHISDQQEQIVDTEQEKLVSFDNSGNGVPHNLGDSSDTPDDSQVDSESQTSCDKGIIYVRVSSSPQTEGESLDGQVDDLREVAEEHDITLVREPVRDEGKSGTDFERPGIQEVFYYAKRGSIDHLLIDDISRLGRSAPETIYFIYILRERCDVRLLTPTGRVDINQIDGLISATMKSLNAELATQYRTESSIRSRVRNFTKKSNWNSGHRDIPLGYQPRDDGWIEPDSTEVEVAQEMFEHFITSESYAATTQYLNNHFSGNFDEELSYGKVKKHLSQPVYIGEPAIRTENEYYEDDKQTVDDPALQIIGQKTFREAQEVIRSISEKYSTEDETVDVQSAVAEFGLTAVVQSSPIIKLFCPEPECDGELRCNGQRSIDGTIQRHNFQCKECGRQRQWPYLTELAEMRSYSGQNTGGDMNDSE